MWRHEFVFIRKLFVAIFKQMLRPEEVEMLVCGNPNLNMADLKKVTSYDGFSCDDVTIR